MAFPLVILLFPDGRLPSPRWRWVLCAYLAGVAGLISSGYVAVVSVIAAHDMRVDSSGGLAAIDDPAGRTAWLSIALLLILPVLLTFWLVFAGRLVVSWRRAAGQAGEAAGERRQQLKWLMTGSVTAIVAGAVNSIITALDSPAPAAVQAITGILNDAGLLVFAICVGIAILRSGCMKSAGSYRALAYAIVTGLLVGRRTDRRGRG